MRLFFRRLCFFSILILLIHPVSAQPPSGISEDEAHLRSVISNDPGFMKALAIDDLSHATITPVTGDMLSLCVWKVSLDDRDFVIKIVRDPEALRAEVKAYQAIKPWGIAPELLYHNPERHLMLMEYIEHTVPKEMAYEASMDTVIAQMKKIHGVDCKGLGIEKFDHEKYLDLPNTLRDRYQRLEGFENLRMKMECSIKDEICKLIEEGPLVLVHGDLHGGNVLSKSPSETYVIDWGSACVTHPSYDLACFSIVLPSTPYFISDLLRRYKGREPSHQELEQLYLLRIMADMWRVDSCQGNAGSYTLLQEDFEITNGLSLAHFWELMAHPHFQFIERGTPRFYALAAMAFLNDAMMCISKFEEPSSSIDESWS